MTIYFIMTEAVPNSDNPESKELGGAYVNCFVKAKTSEEAQSIANEYILGENWTPVETKEMFIAKKDSYINEPESLDCYDEACEYGASGIFYTWSVEK